MTRRIATRLALLQISMNWFGLSTIAAARLQSHLEPVPLEFLQERKEDVRRWSLMQNKTSKKQVHVHIESGCPDSQAFCLGPLMKALSPYEGLTNYINVSLIAWGNAYHTGVAGCESHQQEQYNRDGSLCWQRSCKNGTQSENCFNKAMTSVHQHGTKEGQVDKLLNCAVAHADSPWPYVKCVIAHYENTSNAAMIADTCGFKIYGAAESIPAAIDACATSQEGSMLLMNAARDTPKHPGVPYVTIDGEAIDPDEFFAELCGRLHVAQVPPACASVGHVIGLSMANMTSMTPTNMTYNMTVI